jgi:hypothetical protein
MDANRGEEWLAAQVSLIVTEAQRLDAAEEVASAAAGSSDDDSDGERLPARLGDRSHRTQRIRQAAQEVAEQTRRRARAQREREEAALARRRRSEGGGPVVGRIPDGPHRLAEAVTVEAVEGTGTPTDPWQLSTPPERVRSRPTVIRTPIHRRSGAGRQDPAALPLGVHR